MNISPAFDAITGQDSRRRDTIAHVAGQIQLARYHDYPRVDYDDFIVFREFVEQLETAFELAPISPPEVTPSDIITTPFDQQGNALFNLTGTEEPA